MSIDLDSTVMRVQFLKSCVDGFENDLKVFDDQKLDEELSREIDELQELESWVEALSAEKQLRALRKEITNG